MTELASQSRPSPTILLIHGAWDNGSAWDLVVAELAYYGYPSATPSLPSAGGRPPVRSHLQDVEVVQKELEHLIHQEGREVIVVEHSYGGFVAIECVSGFEKHRVAKGGAVHCLVMSAFVGCKGDHLMAFFDDKLPEFLKLDPRNPEYVIVAGAEDAFYNDVDAQVAEKRLATAAPHSYATLQFKARAAMLDYTTPTAYR